MILQDLSVYNKIGTLEYVESAQTIEQAFPKIDKNKYEIFTLQADRIYTLQVEINYISQRLYYNILNDNSDYIIKFAPLIEYPNNLLTNKELESYFLFFKNNSFYFGSLNA